MSKNDPEEKVALASGFHDGRRIHRGETFMSTKDHEARWFKPAASEDKDVKAALSGDPDVLDQSIPAIMKVLPGMSVAELRTLKQNEQNGKTRRGLIAKIDDEIANRAGQPTDELMG